MDVSPEELQRAKAILLRQIPLRESSFYDIVEWRFVVSADTPRHSPRATLALTIAHSPSNVSYVRCQFNICGYTSAHRPHIFPFSAMDRGQQLLHLPVFSQGVP